MPSDSMPSTNLLEQRHLLRVHAKVAVLLEELLGACVGVVRGHDRKRDLALSLACVPCNAGMRGGGGETESLLSMESLL